MTTQQNLKIVGKLKKYISAKKDDQLIKNVSKRIFDYLEEKYFMNMPDGYSFEYSDYIDTKFVEEYWKLNNANPSDMEWLKHAKSNTENFVRVKPDGGYIFIKQVDENNNMINQFPVLCSEMKKQGTNPNQAKGNAIERSFKNISFFCNAVCKFSDVSPFIVFCHGIDFNDAGICSRFIIGTQCKINTFDYLKSNDGRLVASIFTKEDSFSEDELFDYCKKLADLIMNHYLNTIFTKKEKKSFIQRIFSWAV